MALSIQKKCCMARRADPWTWSLREPFWKSSKPAVLRAAEQLNVSQTAVSARIRTLEEQLGRPLFVRNKNGASLTAAGEQFLRYAPMFVQLWQRARHQVAVPPGGGLFWPLAVS